MVGHPLKLVFSKKRARVIFFENDQEKKEWRTILKEASGCSDILDYYELKEKLGEGQFGVVFKGIHLESKKEVAIKTANKAEMDSDTLSFNRKEIETLKMLQHPSIVRLIDVFEDEKYFYLVLELLKGGDLYDYLSAFGFDIPESRAKELSAQIGEAISYAHSYAIVHRDIKLENIMMTSNDPKAAEAKLVDFGMAFLAGPGQTAKELLGTIAYAAPELLLEHDYGAKVDAWSFGVVVYCLVSGTLPYEHEDQEETGRMIIQDELTFRSRKWKTLSPQTKDLIQKLLQKDPQKRITMKEALEHPWFLN